MSETHLTTRLTMTDDTTTEENRNRTVSIPPFNTIA